MSDKTILVTGGAGYIGAHTCMRLAEAGFTPVAFDNLSNGHADFAQWGPLEQGDVRDAERVEAIFAAHRPAAVIHFAALIEVGESVKRPMDFYDVNVSGALNVANAARRAGAGAFIFSSTCATYGDPVEMPMTEGHPQRPLNPYGHSKLMVERALTEMARAGELSSVILRYFNASGADPEGRIGEHHDPETHAIPLALDAALGLRGFAIFGSDYPTRDGTAERDYIHVIDLADAHVLALKHLLGGGKSDAFNVGTGRGTTVRELLDAIERVTGRTVPARAAERREGDATALVADNRRIREMLGWAPRFGLDEIVGSAWDWHRKLHSS